MDYDILIAIGAGVLVFFVIELLAGIGNSNDEINRTRNS